MQSVTPVLWFDGNAVDAARLWTSVIPNSRILTDIPYPEGGDKGDPGTVMVVDFELDGRRYAGLNGGPQFPFSECVSLQVTCDDQAEVDRIWAALLEGGGSESQCGWLKDRFGFSWQVVPKRLFELFGDPDPQVVARVNQRMVKLDVAALEAAASGATGATGEAGATASDPTPA
ncbi:VOC family protein [Arsenicicoccus sp. oral taxon 190]|uniref:VOC family protein n=1 Tax=Arsenicicoccus sp. oral taxon 190 TaxID=1658671 RepID=UPI00067A40C2|nr:VOC family protein [Arsenicicoccus sp. oral taxon 190]AKT51765.1 3-demethylubiquinone-9 3-methyltransferase [Arsenicicoccus sp. oral taxon 190]